MLDVHPPHAPTHTWRDFFIHIATICVGLLIAIGLEQSVEAYHHHLQREELIADFRGECRRNIEITQLDIRLLRNDRAWQQRHGSLRFGSMHRIRARSPSRFLRGRRRC